MQRREVLLHLAAGTLSLEQAAAVLHRSERQVRRLLAAYEREGPAALVHGNAGRAPINRTDPALRERLMELTCGSARSDRMPPWWARSTTPPAP